MNRKFLRALINNPEHIRSLENADEILSGLMRTHRRLVVKMVKKSPNLVSFKALQNLEFIMSIVVLSYGYTQIEGDVEYGARGYDLELMENIVRYLPPNFKSEFFKRFVEYSSDNFFYVPPQNITPQLLDIWLEADQAEAEEREAAAGQLAAGDHQGPTHGGLNNLKWIAYWGLVPDDTLLHAIRKDPSVVVAQATREMNAYGQLSTRTERVIEVWKTITGEEWVTPEPVAPVDAQARQGWRPERPEEDDRLPHRDVQSSKLLGKKGGYSVRGLKGHRWGRIPGRILSTEGEHFVLSIGSLETDLIDKIKQLPEQLPAEMYDMLDLHGLGKRADLKRFIGWIGGTYTEDTMWVSEAQSDLMQLTSRFQTPEAWIKRAQKISEKAKKELVTYRKELRDLKKQYEHGPLAQRYKLVELIGQVEERYKEAMNKLRQGPPVRFAGHRNLIPVYSQYRSVIENLHKEWIEAFYHIAIWYAKHLKINTLFIAKSERIADAWDRKPGTWEGKETIYTRAYDGMAQKLQAKDVGDWWQLDISEFIPKEGITRIANMISEHVDSSVILEGMTPRDIQSALERAGYTNIKIHKAPEDDQEYQRVDLFAAKADGDQFHQIGQPKMDLTDDEIDQAIATAHEGETRLLSQDELDGIEELEEDATLLITAAKQSPDGQWFGVSVVCLDDPKFQFDMQTYRAQEDEPDESDIDAISQDDLENMFKMPAYGEDPEAF